MIFLKKNSWLIVILSLSSLDVVSCHNYGAIPRFEQISPSGFYSIEQDGISLQDYRESPYFKSWLFRTKSQSFTDFSARDNSKFITLSLINSQERSPDKSPLSGESLSAKNKESFLMQKDPLELIESKDEYRSCCSCFSSWCSNKLKC